MIEITGGRELVRRLEAVKDLRGFLRTVQLDAVREAKMRVPRKTGNLGRTITPGTLTDKFAIVQATAGYAAFVERGTRPHVIVPRRAKALSWAASGADARLSGRVRTGGSRRFAKRVNHPGTKPQPFLVPGAKAALSRGGARQIIIKNWNEAA